MTTFLSQYILNFVALIVMLFKYFNIVFILFRHLELAGKLHIKKDKTTESLSKDIFVVLFLQSLSKDIFVILRFWLSCFSSTAKKELKVCCESCDERIMSWKKTFFLSLENILNLWKVFLGFTVLALLRVPSNPVWKRCPQIEFSNRSFFGFKNYLKLLSPFRELFQFKSFVRCHDP